MLHVLPDLHALAWLPSHLLVRHLLCLALPGLPALLSSPYNGLLTECTSKADEAVKRGQHLSTEICRK